MTDTLWYYATGDEQFGPVPLAELKQLVEAGKLSPDDLLWREGMDAWMPAMNLRALFEQDRMPPGPAGPAAPAPALARQRPLESEAPRIRPPDSSATARTPPAGHSLPPLIRGVQLVLWAVCVLVVLVGLVLLTRAFLSAKDAGEEAA